MVDIVDLSGESPKITSINETPMDGMIRDLERSGLVYSDVRTRVLDESTRVACGVASTIEGYVIPYYDMRGKALPFYRVKLLDHHVKYLQPKGSANHVYFPPTFADAFAKYKYKVLVLTEGEKKAALACKLGIPCAGFGGVDSWNNRSIQIPKISEIGPSKTKGLLNVKLPSTNIDENFLSTMATGMQDMLDICLQNGTMVFIVYDTGTPKGVSVQVQKSAARLGLELRFKGLKIGNIRQIILPYLESERDGGWEESPGEHQTGLDTYLLADEGGAERFMELMHATQRKRLAFPRHPAIREYVATRLQKKNLDRKQWQNLSISVISELDSIGARMYSANSLQMYYFDNRKHHLMKVDLNRPNPGALNDEEFGKLLYQNFSISPSADAQLMRWLATQFSSEDPVINVEPHRLIAKPKRGEDIVRYQINNGEYIEASAKGFKVLPNGANGVLFESNMEHGTSGEKLTEWLTRLSKVEVNNWWLSVLKEVRIKASTDDKQARLVSYLYYISPFLYGWRGLQLPVEMIIGEAGSGKSTLAEIRLTLITGDPHLRNTPDSIKDWYASLSNVGGFHVTDNVHLTDKNFKQRVSDELCRLVTDPEPRIEMRKYFTEADQRIIKINSVFGFTAIQQPFQNQDIIQRSIILELEKGPDAEFDSYWKDRQIEKFGGRAAWLAHHMIVLHKFFVLVGKSWNASYRAKHRLVHLEQSLMMMAKVLGDPEGGEWIPDFLAKVTSETIVRNDYTLEALGAWIEYFRKYWRKDQMIFCTSDVAEWAKSSEYKDVYTIINTRSLGRYMQLNKSMIEARLGVINVKSIANKQYYGLKKGLE